MELAKTDLLDVSVKLAKIEILRTSVFLRRNYCK